MSRTMVIAWASLAAAGLAGCGAAESDTCTSKAAQVQSVGSCSVSPGNTANIRVQLCGTCAEQSPSCQAEFRNGAFEVAPTFQECAGTQGCNIGNGCTAATVTCSVSAPASASSYPVIDASTGGQVGSVTVAAGASGC